MNNKRQKKESILHQISDDVIQEWIFCHFDYIFLLKTFCLICKEYKDLCYSDLTWDLMMKRMFYKPALDGLFTIIDKFKRKKDAFKRLIRVHKFIVYHNATSNCSDINIGILKQFDLNSYKQIQYLELLMPRFHISSDIIYSHFSYFDIKEKRFASYQPSIYDKCMIMRLSNGDVYKGEFEYDIQTREFRQNGGGIWYYKDGTREELEYKHGKKDGKSILYDKNLRLEHEYKNGIEEGKAIEYGEDIIITEFEFKHGKKDGKVIKYFSNGQKLQFKYKNGEREGNAIVNWTDGGIEEYQYIKSKRDGKAIHYFALGDVDEFEYKNGKREGKAIFHYYPKESGYLEYEYKNDIEEGEAIDYCEGLIREKFFFKNGQREGKAIRYIENTREEFEYKNGKREGKAIKYFSNGEYIEYQYINDKIEGKVFEHCIDGKIIVFNYKNGEREGQII